MTTAAATDSYLAALANMRARLPGEGVSWVRRLREAGASRFADKGFPTTRDEHWKYTNVAPLLRQPYAPVAATANIDAATLVRDAAFGDLRAHRLVFVNGWYAAALSSAKVPAGVTVGSLAQQLARPDGLESYLGSVAPSESHGFAALNSAFLADGAYIRVSADVVVEQPIHLIYLATGKDAQLLIQPRNLIVVERGAQVSVIEHYLSPAEAAHLTNAITEVVMESGTVLEHYRVQQHGVKASHVDGTYVRQARDSRFTSHAIDLGGLLVRNELRSVLNDEGAQCHFNGLYVVDGRSHVDNHTEVDHAKPRGTSREFYKGVLNGRGRAVFNGRVIVRPDAQQTDAEQMNNNLLLSDDAEVDTKPELEIYADDVKCSHGATVGQLDTEALFYLRSRAVDEAAARDLLTYAFAHDVLSRMRLAPVRVELERRLTKRLLAGRDIKELELV